MKTFTTLFTAALLLGAAHPASAQQSDEAMQRLMKMQATGMSYEAQLIDQSGPKAEQLKKHLEQIKLPPGFKIGL